MATRKHRHDMSVRYLGVYLTLGNLYTMNRVSDRWQKRTETPSDSRLHATPVVRVA